MPLQKTARRQGHALLHKIDETAKALGTQGVGRRPRHAASLDGNSRHGMLPERRSVNSSGGLGLCVGHVQRANDIEPQQSPRHLSVHERLHLVR